MSAPHRIDVHQHGLAARRGEPIADQVGQHVDVEAAYERRRPSAAAQPCSGKYFERPALFRTEVTFSRRHSDYVRRRRHRGKSPAGYGGVSQGEGHKCPVRTFPTYLSRLAGTVA
jgi:hypothetical protein